MSPRLVVVGPPGAGKTTVGTILAARLDVGFRDTDHDVETAAGKSVSDIFVDDGEPRFRELERAAASTALVEHDGVLALGGGAVESEQTRMALRGCVVVHLAVGFADAAGRVGLNRDRPLLLPNPRAQLRALLAARRPLYDDVATITVDTSGRSPDEVAADVLARLP